MIAECVPLVFFPWQDPRDSVAGRAARRFDSAQRWHGSTAAWGTARVNNCRACYMACAMHGGMQDCCGDMLMSGEMYRYRYVRVPQPGLEHA